MSTSYPKDNSKCICKLCKATISTGGKSAKSYSTTNMLNHIKKIHSDEAKAEKAI